MNIVKIRERNNESAGCNVTVNGKMSERNNKIAVSNSKMSERNDKSAGCKFQWQNVTMQEQNYSSKIPEDNNKRAGSNSKISEHNNKTAGSNSRIPC